MKKNNIFILTLVLFIFSSCKKYLAAPNKLQQDIKTVDQLDALMNDVYLFTEDVENRTVVYSTDDTEITPELYKAKPTEFRPDQLFYYVFDIGNIVDLGSDELWQVEFKKIFTANVVLSNIDEVTGTQALKNKVKADAYFVRAYSYWTLANYYCLPYSAANLQSKGLPLKRTTIYTESLQRASLQETYNFILADIAAAQALLPANDVNPLLRWRASKPAIDAFLSRFYLFTGEYDKAIQYANTALNSTTVQLVDYNSLQPGQPEIYSDPDAVLNYAELNDWQTNQILFWNEFYYVRLTNNRSNRYIPSTNLLSLYDTNNDLRYQLFMIPDGGRRFGVVTPAQFRYTVFFDGSSLPYGPTLAEVLLNKAEASARKGNVAEALTAVNLLRAKRLKNRDDLTAADKNEALTKILQERRRELPFSFRWLDIRRFSVNEDSSDDVSITRNFYNVMPGSVDINTMKTYTLPVKSLRYAVPINGLEITNSHREIEQNNY